MSYYDDGFRVLRRSTFSLFLEISHLMLTLCQPGAAGCIYEKYFQKILDETYATVYASMGIQSYLDCEKICLEHGFICVGANVYASGRHHVCSLFSEIRTPITEDKLLINRNGKLIVKTKGLCENGFTFKFQKSHYCFNKEKVNQRDATLYCKSIGAQLISLEKRDEFDDIKQRLNSAANGDTWVSAKRDGNSAVFRWSSGMELTTNSNMWAPGEPGGAVRCVIIWPAGGYNLNDVPCYTLRAVLCEIQLE